MIQDNPSLIEPTLKALQAGYRTGKTRNVEFRKQALRNMITGLQALAPKFIEAHLKDLGIKEPYIVRSSHLGSVINDANHIIQCIDKWAKPRQADCNVFIGGGEAYIQPEPYGVCLVLGAWNFPLPLCLKPAAAAISAGNCVCVKPSEISPNISNVIKELFDKYMDKECYVVLEGGIQLASQICSFPWDLIFFTGGSFIGKKVARAASENLVPCILELGGKSPTIVDFDADVTSAALRIANTKLSNLGQICVAPDYIYVHKSVKDQLVQQIISFWRQFYGDNPQQSKDLPRIVNDFHVKRLTDLLSDNHGGNVLHGGQVDEADRYVSPTLVDNPKLDSKMMSEEIFGPILPILTFENLNEVIEYVNRNPKPLALYYFGQSKERQNQIIDQTSSGGVLINDCFIHLLNDELPFGGVGNSGYGHYHGIYGFDNCSHLKPVMKKGNYNGFPYNNRFPPFTPDKMNKMRKFSQYGSKILVGKLTKNIKLGAIFILLLILFWGISGSENAQKKSDL